MKTKRTFISTALISAAFILSNIISAQAQCTISGDLAVCRKDTATYILSPAPSVGEYTEWVIMKGMVLQSTDSTVTIVWTGSPIGMVKARVRNAAMQIIDECEVDVVIDEQPALEIKTFLDLLDQLGCHLCFGSEEEFCVAEYLGGNYTWTYSANTLLIDDGECITLSLTDTGYFDICVTVTTATGCIDSICKSYQVMGQDTSEIIVSEISTPPYQLCRGQQLHFQAANPTNRMMGWEIRQSGSLIRNSNEEVLEHTFSQAGTYEVILNQSDNCGCPYQPDTIQVIVSPDPAVEITCPSVVCHLDTITYVADGGCSTYEWTVQGSSTFWADSNELTVVWDAVPIGGVGVIKLVVSGCSPSLCSDTVYVDVPILPSLIHIMGETTHCGGSAAFTAPDFPGAIYNWSFDSLPGSNGIETVTSFGSRNLINYDILKFLGPARISLSIYHPLAGCSSTGSIDIEVFGPKGFNQISQPDCVGDDVTLGLTSSPPGSNYSLIWIIKERETGHSVYEDTIQNNPNVIIPGTVFLPNTQYDYCVELWINGVLVCNREGNPINLFQRPSTIISFAGPDSVCLNTWYEYSVLDTFTGTLEWQVEGGSGSPNVGSMVLAQFDGSTSPTIKVVRQYQGCVSDTFVFMPVIRDSVQVDIVGPTNVCYDQVVSYSNSFAQGADPLWSIVPSSAGTIISGQRSNTIEVWWHDAAGVTQAQVVLDVEACGVPTQATQTVNVSAGEAPELNIVDGICFNDTTTFQITANGQALGVGVYVWDFGDGTVDTTTVAIHTHRFLELKEYLVKVTILESVTCLAPNIAVTRFFPQREVRARVTSDKICLNPEAIFFGGGGIPVRYFAVLPGGTDTTGVTYKWYKNGTFVVETTDPYLDRSHAPTGPPNIGLLDDTMSVQLCGLPCPGPSNQYVIPHCIDPPDGSCPTNEVVDIIDYDLDCEVAEIDGAINLFDNTKDRAWIIFDEYHPDAVNGRRVFSFDNSFALIDFEHPFSEPGDYYAVLTARCLNSITGDTNCLRAADTIIHVPMVADVEFESVGCDTDSLSFTLRDISRYIPDVLLLNTVQKSWQVEQMPLGAGEDSITIKVARGDTATVQLILTSGSISCIKEVQIPALPALHLSTSPALVGCEDSPILFSGSVNDPSQVAEYRWIFSDGSRSRLESVEKTLPFTGSSDTAVFQVTSIYGCIYSDTVIFDIAPNTLDGEIQVDTPVCPAVVSLQFNQLAGGQIVSYEWSNGENANDVSVSESGPYQVTVTDENGCQWISDEVFVAIDQPAFYSDLVGPQKACASGTSFFLNFSGNPEYTYQVSDDSPIVQTNLFPGYQVRVIPSVTNTQDTVTVMVSAFNNGQLCDVRTFSITIIPSRTPQVTQEVVSCLPFQVRMSSTNGDTLVWTDQGGSFTTISDHILVSDPGRIFFYYPDRNECEPVRDVITLEPIDLSAFLDGCYDICEDSLIGGDVILPGVSGVYSFWAYIHESGDTLASGSGTVQDLVLLPEHAGKIRLYVEREYGLTTCTAYSDPVCLIVENCGQCPNDSLSNGSATINHFTTIGGVFEVYDINVSIPLLAGYDVCNDCNASFEILDWIDGPYCQDDGNGNLVITGKAGYITGDCEGEDVLHLEMCYNGEPCPFTLPVTYVCCPELECTIWLEEEFGGDYLCIYANIDATAAEYCDDEFATIGFENFGQYLFLGQGVQNPKIVQIQAGKLNYKACFPITLEDLPLCFNITMAATGCEFWCTSQVCVGEGLTNGGVSNEAIAQCLGSNAEGDNVYSLTWALNDDDLVKSAWVQSVVGGQLEGTSVAGDELSVTISANPAVTVLNPTIYVLDTNDVNYVIDQSIVLPTCGSGGGNDPLISGGNKNERRQAQEANLLIVPNPSDQGAIIHYNTDQTISSTPLEACIDVIGFDGQLIYRVEDITEARGQIDTRPLDLPTGVYYIILKVEGEVKSYEPMLITR